MSAEPTDALILRVFEFSETSLIVWLYTRESGKVHALAKGARRPKSPFEGALDLLSRCRVMILAKQSDALDLLTEAKLDRRFRAASKSLTHLYAGYYVAELLDGLTELGEPQPALFDAATTTIAELDALQPALPIVLRFELTLLTETGHRPTLDVCAVCGGAVAATGRIAFGMKEGGILCQAHRESARNVISFSRDTLRALRWAAGEADRAIAGEAGTGTPPPSLTGEVRGVINRYIAYHTGRQMKLPKFLASLD